MNPGFKYRDEVEKDIQAGNRLGLTGTPAVFINGQAVKPDYVPTFADISRAVRAALAEK